MLKIDENNNIGFITARFSINELVKIINSLTLTAEDMKADNYEYADELFTLRGSIKRIYDEYKEEEKEHFRKAAEAEEAEGR
jgi:hypothetical protein